MIQCAEGKDALTLSRLAIQMWEDNTLEKLEEEFSELLSSEEARCFIKYVDGTTAGFAQCQLRHDYVEGTDTSPVGYLEGIFVLEKYRNRGYAKELLQACECWAKEKGCSEFASDCELDNTASFQFHRAMGFEEANRVICFRKEI
ncbi:MAG: GNAT family N-acetyltransferase [Lachnospiraceae bacterium]|nr:GNAT family N-acetyltransferase [Lachnospiraceae bacterium]